jgi:hypothetical protein
MIAAALLPWLIALLVLLPLGGILILVRHFSIPSVTQKANVADQLTFLSIERKSP